MNGAERVSCRPVATPCPHASCESASPVCEAAAIRADELPGGAARLAGKPGDGWTATATFAAGVVETKAGPTPMRSTAVRLAHRDGHRAVAWWTNGKPDAAAYRPASWPWWTMCGVAELARVVKLASPAKRRRGEAVDRVPADPFDVEPAELDEVEP